MFVLFGWMVLCSFRIFVFGVRMDSFECLLLFFIIVLFIKICLFGLSFRIRLVIVLFLLG